MKRRWTRSAVEDLEANYSFRSKASPNYEHWLKRCDSAVVLENLYVLSISSAVHLLSQCDALLLTGGEDVYPALYGKEADTARCTEMNRHRDSLEFALISKALELKMPLFAICRGHQILNVFMKGTLIIDIPKDIGVQVIHQCADYAHCIHSVTVSGKSLLASISQCDSSMVTTNHHQAVGRLSPMLMANAYSRDNLVEGIEWKNPSGKSFLMGVQWHPERMEKTNPLSGPLAKAFIRQARIYAKSHQVKPKE
ncbi:MAG: gamma-glutamyl-gamma-aminobutyrate hydrolase family protein [Bacteroidota bacterium]